MKPADKGEAMTQLSTGWAIHLHHDILVEWCYDYDERVREIRREKPVAEQEIRLRLFKLLPTEAVEKLPEEWVKAYAEWEKAKAECRKAYAEWMKSDAARMKADAKYWKAYAKYWKADVDGKKVYAEWRKASGDSWHRRGGGCKEWHGTQIVFEREK